MSRYTPNGKTHKVLRRLALRSALPHELLEAVGLPPESHGARKFPRLLSAICRDGLASRYSADGHHWLRPRGFWALRQLEAGLALDSEDFCRVDREPNVRTFTTEKRSA